MTWFAKHKWSRRQVDLERKALASSIEEFTREKPACAAEDEEETWAGSGDPALIPPRLRPQSRPMPAVRIAEIPREPAHEEHEPSAPSRRLGHTTKVRLQAVRQEPVTERVTASAAAAQEGHVRPASRFGWLKPAVATSPATPPPAMVNGSGVIEAGQEDVIVHNPGISRQSVVTVMLAGDPGAVVVHYISLHPRVGFTLHLTAPVTSSTPFNYLAWLC